MLECSSIPRKILIAPVPSWPSLADPEGLAATDIMSLRSHMGWLFDADGTKIRRDKKNASDLSQEPHCRGWRLHVTEMRCSGRSGSTSSFRRPMVYTAARLHGMEYGKHKTDETYRLENTKVWCCPSWPSTHTAVCPAFCGAFSYVQPGAVLVNSLVVLPCAAHKHDTGCCAFSLQVDNFREVSVSVAGS